MSISVIVHFEVKNEKLSAFLDILENVKTDLPQVSGCLGVKVFRNIDIPNQFTLVEKWRSRDQHTDHINQLCETGAWDMISAHLCTAPVSAYFEQG